MRVQLGLPGLLLVCSSGQCLFLPPPSSVGTFARALDCSSSVRQPSLHMSAAAASRDITLVSRCQPSKAQHVCLGQAPGHGPTQGRALGALAWQPRLRTGSG